MIADKKLHWYELNKKYLMHSIELVYYEISHRLKKEGSDDKDNQSSELIGRINEIRNSLKAESTLDRLARLFQLSDFEKNIIIACAGVELNSQHAQFWKQVHENDNFVHPSFAVLLQCFASAHWDAISPDSPLQKWNLIHFQDATLMINRPIKIDEHILHYLTGCSTFDTELSFYIHEVTKDYPLAKSQSHQVEKISDLLVNQQQKGEIIELLGNNTDDLANMARQIARNIGSRMYQLSLSSLSQVQNIKDILHGWNRLSLLQNYCLFIDLSQIDNHSGVVALLRLFIDNCHSLVFTGSKTPFRNNFQTTTTFEVPEISSDDQTELWGFALRDQKEKPQIHQLVNQYRLSAGKIAEIARTFSQKDDDQTDNEIWNTCRKFTKPALDNLAEHIDAKATWQDIILPEDVVETMREIVLHVRYRNLVYQDGGFAKKSSRGLGISALFYGESGTGKTMAAEVLANELNLDLYRIDLSQVVNKYIGETEKNLKKIFDAAENGGSILLFDEADTLFGKRSEVRDSHDRYSNLQIGYLLQRMEEFKGLSILTTNMKNAIDKAFERRIRFIAQFERPDQQMRHKIWKKAFPNREWVNGVNYQKLAQINLPGGNIKNIAMNAAFLAISENEKIGMDHLLRATKNEFKKLDKRLSNSEIKDWDETEY